MKDIMILIVEKYWRKSTIQKTAEKLIYYIIEIASGNKITNSNKLNQNDFIPWKRGVSL